MKVHQEVLDSVPEYNEDFVPETEPVLVLKDEDHLPETGLSSEELRSGILKDYESIHTSYFGLCCKLYEAWKKKRYESWGFGTWKQYLQEEMGLKVAKANYLKKMWMNLGDKPEIRDKLKPFGWDKVKELERVITSENVDYWIEKAKHVNCEELKKEVKNHLKNMVPDDAKGMMDKESEVRGTTIETQLHPHTFQFQYDSKGIVLSAVEKVQNETGSSASESLALICADYMGSAPENAEKDRIEHVLAMIKKYEKQLPMKFVVVETVTNELIHGAQTLTDLVKTALNTKQAS